MNEIKLNMRYPESRLEDVTDAYTRGFEVGLAMRTDENAKLREHVRMPDEPLEIDEKDFYVRAFIKWATEEQPEVKRLEAENEKLRELVRDMHKWLWNGADCTECPFVAKCDLNAAFESDIHAHVCLGWSEIHRRMRELGVGA